MIELKIRFQINAHFDYVSDASSMQVSQKLCNIGFRTCFTLFICSVYLYCIVYSNVTIVHINIVKNHQRLVSLFYDFKEAFFSWSYSYFFSTRCLFSFSFYLQNNYFNMRTFFLTYRKNKFCRLFFMLLNVRLKEKLKP